MYFFFMKWLELYYEIYISEFICRSVKGSTPATSLQRLESQYPRPEIQNTLLQIPVLHQKLNSMCKLCGDILDVENHRFQALSFYLEVIHYWIWE